VYFITLAAHLEPTMAEFRRPSRLFLVILAVALPAIMGWACRGLLHVPATPAADGIIIELPAAPAAASLHHAGHADDA